jgi:RimJ/RimL family protein N-acetyltransferase
MPSPAEPRRTLHVPVLVGEAVRLEPMTHDHVAGIARAGAGDRRSFGWTEVPDGIDAARRYVDWLLGDAAHLRAAPLVQRRRGDDVVVGCTRFLHPAWQLGRAAPDEVEIGGTWLTADAQRTAINTEAKLLLLDHAFDAWGVQRVAICTDARNTRSRNAIERIGATFEGVLRRHRRSTATDESGLLRDTAVYSIVEADWAEVRRRLVERRDRARTADLA